MHRSEKEFKKWKQENNIATTQDAFDRFYNALLDFVDATGVKGFIQRIMIKVISIYWAVRGKNEIL